MGTKLRGTTDGEAGLAWVEIRFDSVNKWSRNSAQVMVGSSPTPVSNFIGLEI